jgi:8-oxo-dGTP diphosphatase
VFDDPTRDDRGWVMSVAHQAVVPHHVFGGVVEGRNDLMLASVGSRVGADGVVPVAALPGGQRSLPFDHDRIVGLAVDSLRRRYREAPDPDGLVAQPFTLLDLRLVHEAVEGVPLQKDTFRRHVMPGLEQVEGRSDGTVGRPARLYRRT